MSVAEATLLCGPLLLRPRKGQLAERVCVGLRSTSSRIIGEGGFDLLFEEDGSGSVEMVQLHR